MRSLFTTHLLICFSLLVHGQSGPVDTLDLPREHYQLKNGLQIVLQPDPSVKDVSVEFWLRDGMRIDPEEQYGFAHFFEHIMLWSPILQSQRIRFGEKQ